MLEIIYLYSKYFRFEERVCLELLFKQYFKFGLMLNLNLLNIYLNLNLLNLNLVIFYIEEGHRSLKCMDYKVL